MWLYTIWCGRSYRLYPTIVRKINHKISEYQIKFIEFQYKTTLLPLFYCSHTFNG